MPKYRISVINEEFTAVEERELPDADAARQEGLRGAIAMGADQIIDGAPTRGVFHFLHFVTLGWNCWARTPRTVRHNTAAVGQRNLPRS
jgi:hypothetical protein